MKSRLVKFALAAVAVIALLAVLVVAVGFALPERHRAAVRAHYAQQVDAVHQAILDVAAAPTWRSGVDSVHILSQQPLTWREYTDWGTLTMAMVEASPARIVSRIVDTGQGFGGTWTFEVMPDADGTTLTITEDGEVYNPIFRVMSKFVFGHYTGLEAYAADLGRKFDEDVQPERVTRVHKALQRSKAFAGLSFPASGRRDLNPRPPEPHIEAWKTGTGKFAQTRAVGTRVRGAPRTT